MIKNMQELTSVLNAGRDFVSHAETDRGLYTKRLWYGYREEPGYVIDKHNKSFALTKREIIDALCQRERNLCGGKLRRGFVSQLKKNNVAASVDGKHVYQIAKRRVRDFMSI